MVSKDPETMPASQNPRQGREGGAKAMTRRIAADAGNAGGGERPNDSAFAGYFEEDQLSAEAQSGGGAKQEGSGRGACSAIGGRVSDEPDGEKAGGKSEGGERRRTAAVEELEEDRHESGKKTGECGGEPHCAHCQRTIEDWPGQVPPQIRRWLRR